MTKPAKRSVRVTHDGRCVWIIQDKKIDLYVVDKLEPEGDTTHALRLTKSDGAVYTVAVNTFGPQCCCPDANYRSRRCKHILALQAGGFLPKDLHGYHDGQEEAEENKESHGQNP